MTHNRSERFTREPARHYRDREDQSYLWEKMEGREVQKARPEAQIRRGSTHLMVELHLNHTKIINLADEVCNF